MPTYKIYHIHLEESGDTFDSIKEACCYYITVWWHQIPLGYFYINEEDKLDRSDLQLRVIRSIQPCVDFYLSNSEFTDKNYISAFLSNNQTEFKNIMKGIFLPYEIYIPKQTLDISVIICTRNRSIDLRHCLTSLKHQKYPVREIIVIDNAPSDLSTKDVVGQFTDVRYYKTDALGLSIARNAGIRLAKSPIVAFVDDDVTVHELWSIRVAESFHLNEIKAMTGLIIPASLDTLSQQIFEKYWGFTKAYCDKEYDFHFIESHLKKAPPVWTIGAGANMAFRKIIFEDIGYFDERLGAGASGCSEDSEIWFRILLSGFKIKYNPRAISYHTHRIDMKSLKKQLFNYARGHVTAALIQEIKFKDLGYKKRVFTEYPLFYLRRLIKGFPLYRLRNKTLLNEILGWYAGIRLFKTISKTQHPIYIPYQNIIVENVNAPKSV